MRLFYCLFLAVLTIDSFGAAVPLGPVPYSRLNANDFRIDAQGMVWLRLQSLSGTNVYVTNLYSQTIVTTNFYVTNYISGDTIVTINTNVYLTNTYLYLNGTNVASVNPTDNYLPKRASATNFVDSLAHDDGTSFSVDGIGTSTLELVTDDGQIIFGSGGTNVLYRSGNDLVHTNGGTISRITALNGSAKGISLEAQGNAGVIATAGSAPSLTLRAITDQVTLSSGSFGPTVDLTEGLGNINYAWSNTVTGTLWIRGFVDNSGSDYSRLSITHGGTNDAIHFDSQSAGTAGNPVNFEFDTNGTSVLVFDPTSAGQKTTIYDPRAHSLIIDQTGGGTTFTAAADNVFFSPGVISLTGYADPSTTWGGRRIELYTHIDATDGVQHNSPTLLWIASGWSTGGGESQSGSTLPPGMSRFKELILPAN